MFNYHIGILRESGAIDKLLKDEYVRSFRLKKSCVLEDGNSGQYVAISMKNVLSAYTILVIGLGKEKIRLRLYLSVYIHIKDK